MFTRQLQHRTPYGGTQSRRPQVSVIESDPRTRTALVALIKTLAVDVSAYGSAEAFLAILDAVGWSRGCLVVEKSLSGMNALQLLEELQRRGVEAPAIILADDADVPSAVQAVKAGAVDFLEKPFVQQRLLQRIRETLDAPRAPAPEGPPNNQEVAEMSIDFVAKDKQVRQGMEDLHKEIPHTMQGFAALHKASASKGALSVKAKELISMAIGITVRCDGCIAFHVKSALDAGANRDEIVETIGVAILMGGGPSVVYGAEALEALDQFEGAAVA